MSDFRKFTDQMAYEGEPAAKLYKHGQIGFNRIAGLKWFQGVDRVEIFVDESGTEVGFKPASDTTEGTYSFSSEGEHGGHVAFRSVLSKYGIWHERMDESIAVPVRYDDEHEMVVVDIAEAVDRWGHTAKLKGE